MQVSVLDAILPSEVGMLPTMKYVYHLLKLQASLLIST